ncbi:gluconokinase [Kineosporia babensis]|uniref:Gluconokinase n=1 Tax=Kineosporia babensis TaxID=499548 RepID=A0A9X1NM68_9ACTN|nr:gluconokinase [Kineosporia babensis]MCD5316703.1 gluconokinase [Kineosporia babensis]
MTAAPLIVVLGPSGNGKSTLATALSGVLCVDFQDADDLHPQANVAKMAAGVPLTDEDRAPWLRTVHEKLLQSSESGLVLACSALKRRYRETLGEGLPQLRFVLPDVPKDVLLERVARRANHFMPATLVDSQLAALEPLGPDENGITLDGVQPVGELTSDVVAWINTERKE